MVALFRARSCLKREGERDKSEKLGCRGVRLSIAAIRKWRAPPQSKLAVITGTLAACSSYLAYFLLLGGFVFAGFVFVANQVFGDQVCWMPSFV